jgi:hypothetical protein
MTEPKLTKPNTGVLVCFDTSRMPGFVPDGRWESARRYLEENIVPAMCATHSLLSFSAATYGGIPSHFSLPGDQDTQGYHRVFECRRGEGHSTVFSVGIWFWKSRGADGKDVWECGPPELEEYRKWQARKE